MIKRGLIRQLVTMALSNPNTPHRESGEVGLSLAGHNIYDTPLSTPSGDCSEHSPDDMDLPAIAVYTEDETLAVTDESRWQSMCLDACSLSLLIELYVCARDGIEMDQLLDDLEESVRIKLFNDVDLRNECKIRGWRSVAVRNGQGQRLGLRRIMVNLEYTESVRSADLSRSPLRVSLHTPA